MFGKRPEYGGMILLLIGEWLKRRVRKLKKNE
jgi:hypothetical protein